MNKGVVKTVIGCVAFMALLLGLLVHRILTPPDMTQQQMTEQGLFVYDVPRRFTDFTLKDFNGQPLTRQVFKDRWTLVFFGYTSCPDVCPTTLASIANFNKLLKAADAKAADKLQVLFISVDTFRDTPDKIKAYVQYFNPSYLGATGEYTELFNLAHQLNIAFAYQPGKDGQIDVSHSGEIALINPQGDFHGFFKSPPDPQKMLKTYRSMLLNWRHP
ncbi:MAG TPA: SCO family protein [Candidatus Acidoferrum sp.]|nr:SCO family protein [Candidatus Acidoferrum sp.]